MEKVRTSRIGKDFLKKYIKEPNTNEKHILYDSYFKYMSKRKLHIFYISRDI